MARRGPRLTPVPAERIRADLRFEPDHPAFAGHFPGNPVVPGVLLVDAVVALAESSGLPAGALRLAQVKFLQSLLPGQAAAIEIERAEARWRFRVVRGDLLLCSGEFTPA